MLAHILVEHVWASEVKHGTIKLVMGDQPANTQLKYIKTYHYVKKIEQNKTENPGKSSFLKKRNNNKKGSNFCGGGC